MTKIKMLFYAPQPYASWILNTTTCMWEAQLHILVMEKFIIGMNPQKVGLQFLQNK